MPAAHDVEGTGWRLFAGFMILLAGVFNLISGIVTLRNPHYYVVVGYGNRLVFGDLNTWGWAILGLGIVQIVAGLMIFSGRRWAAIIGIVVATFNAIGQLLYLGVDPWWSIIVLALDVMVIYALARFGVVERPT
jgi:hypothetical protein